MTFLALLWEKIKGWVIALGVVIVAFGSAYLAGMKKGSDKQQAKVDSATQDAQIATQTAQAVETRHDIDQTVQNLPEAHPSPLAKPAPSSAASELADDWLRPKGGN